ncbi:MAG: T9SS type A sorting domain-containing protein [Bacteroidales bacterium]|jgi:hypothetical protein|nr:T9SS type A sorting domain-containing protein [Bacteroidales bacterium]
MKATPLFIVFILITIALQAQITAEFSYEAEICGNSIQVQDISEGESVLSRTWYLNETEIATNADANLTIEVPTYSASDTVTVSLVVQGNSSSDSIAHSIICYEMPNIIACDDFDVCGNEAEISAQSSGFEVNWLPLSSASFDDYTSSNPVVIYGGYGLVQFIVRETNGICTDSDTVKVTFWRKPSAEFLINPSDTSSCGLVAHLPQIDPYTTYTGYWVSPPELAIYQDSVYASNYGNYMLQYVEHNGPDNLGVDFCADTASYAVHFIQAPDITFLNENLSMQNQNYSLMADIASDLSETNLQWSSNNPNLTFISPQNPITQVEYSGAVGSSFQAILETEHLGCTDNDSISINYYLGINSGFGKKQISIYPNPVKDKFSIFSNELNYPLEIRIYTLHGRIAGTYMQNSLKDVLNINLKPGQYIIECTESNGDKYISKCLIMN